MCSNQCNFFLIEVNFLIQIDIWIYTLFLSLFFFYITRSFYIFLNISKISEWLNTAIYSRFKHFFFFFCTFYTLTLVHFQTTKDSSYNPSSNNTRRHLSHRLYDVQSHLPCITSSMSKLRGRLIFISCGCS